MKSRAEVAAFINNQLDNDTKKGRSSCHHYGVLELRDLMDFIYGEPPKLLDEFIAGEYFFRQLKYQSHDPRKRQRN